MGRSPFIQRKDIPPGNNKLQDETGFISLAYLPTTDF